MHEIEPKDQYGQQPDLEELKELIMGQMILLGRMYDLLAVIARENNRLEAEKILDFHEAGRIVSNPPQLTEWE